MSSALKIEARPRVTVVCGRSGSGKSTFALRLLVNDDVACRYIFDPRGEYEDRLHLPACTDPGEMAFAEEDGFVLFDPSRMFPGQHAQAFDWFCQHAAARAAATPGRKVLFVDEVWKYCDRRNIPQSLAVAVQEGRKLQLETLFATQLPHKLAQGITNEMTECVAFNVREALALDALESWGMARAEVDGLPAGAFVAVNRDSGGVLRGRVF
jgi:hypothetical protein